MRVLKLVSPFALLALFGCNTPDPNLVAQSCPTTAVLFQASRVMKLRPNWKDASDVILAADMTQPQLSCDYDAGDNRVSVDLSFPIMVQKGAAATPGPQRLSYFVAVIDAAGNMISKRVFDRNVDLGAANAVTMTESVSGTEIRMAQGRRPFEYEILTGFQLTPEELAYNRARISARQ